MAARKAGITRGFIPESNPHDLKDVAIEVKDGMEIIPVSSVADVLEKAGILNHQSAVEG